MGEYDFSQLPNWVNYIGLSPSGYIVYLETIEKGEDGRVCIDIDGEVNFDSPDTLTPHHAWWTAPADRILAERNPKHPRKLTEEEVEILQDLGLLDYALTEGGYTMEDDQDTSFSVLVFGSDDRLLYAYDDGGEDPRIVHVDQFAKVVGDMYKHLGFGCPMKISFDCGSHGSTHEFNDFD